MDEFWKSQEMDLNIVTNENLWNNINDIRNFEDGQIVSRKEQCWCFLPGTPKIFTVSISYAWNLANSVKSKSTNKIHDIFQGAL